MTFTEAEKTSAVAEAELSLCAKSWFRGVCCDSLDKPHESYSALVDSLVGDTIAYDSPNGLLDLIPQAS